MTSQKTDGYERKHQRYSIDDGGALDHINVIVEGEPVRLANYSLGGLYFLSAQRHYSGDVLHVSIDIKNGAKMDLVGTVVQVRIEEGAWGVTLKLSKNLATAIFAGHGKL